MSTPGKEPEPVPHSAPHAARGPTAVLIALAMAIGVGNALRLWWTSDDAYVSFRYARNLVHGLGLVYNAGERVEGYSNFLWTLWCALGLRLGCAPEAWANATGIACYAATLLLLGVHTRWRMRRGSGAGATTAVALIPWAALIGAVHREWAVFATGALETAQFTLCATAAFLALLRTRDRIHEARAGVSRWAAASGALLALACLSRPDGVLIAALGGAYLVWVARRTPRALVPFAVALVAIVAPYTIWKLHYYGDLRPNTYYAKSADRAWWDQGAFYAWLYFKRYLPLFPVVGLGLGLAGRVAASARARAAAAATDAGASLEAPGIRVRAPDLEPLLLALVFGVTFTVYVMRVGGDFMFARFLIPVTPFLAVALEEGLVAWSGADVRGALRTRLGLAAGVTAIAAVALTPSPVGRRELRGVVDERAFYETNDRRQVEWMAAEQLRELFRGLPIRMAIPGGQALIAYVVDPPVAIEAATGLTDRFIAHLPLRKRGRIGHEKIAPYSYLIQDRRVHFIIERRATTGDTIRKYIPDVRFAYGQTIGYVLTWDPPVMDELRRRGLWTPDYLHDLDEVIAQLDSIDDATAARIYEKACRFYFDGAADSLRQRAFERRLARRQTPPTTAERSSSQ